MDSICMEEQSSTKSQILRLVVVIRKNTMQNNSENEKHCWKYYGLLAGLSAVLRLIFSHKTLLKQLKSASLSINRIAPAIYEVCQAVEETYKKHTIWLVIVELESEFSLELRMMREKGVSLGLWRLGMVSTWRKRNACPHQPEQSTVGKALLRGGVMQSTPYYWLLW